jgi:alanine racemase
VPIIKASWLQETTNQDMQHLLLDSRKLLFPASSLFFAIPGNRRNGLTFIPELYQKGVRAFVIAENAQLDVTNFPEANFLAVKDVLQALQQLAAFHRKHFNFPVIGITGSNGKTIVKEWLYQLLQQQYHIVRSPKSYNSQIGVPLSIWQMAPQHSLGIFEAGISQPDEMDRLEKMIAPNIGIFTNIGEAHSEGFLNIRQKINEKLRLFVKADVLIYHTDHQLLQEAISQFASLVRNRDGFKLFSWGWKSHATLQITAIEKDAGSTTISAQYLSNWMQETVDQVSEETRMPLSITIPFIDDASIENAIHCWCTLLYLQCNQQQIHKGFQQLRTVEMRLELKKGINHCSVINDSYSADINSLTIALDFLSHQKQHPRKTVILSDILQTGKSGRELYQAVAQILAEKQIDQLIGIGSDMMHHQAAFEKIPHTHFFASTSDFKTNFHQIHFHNETILLKGARIFEFEQISHLLEEKVHQTVLDINLNAITHNLQVYQQQLKPGVKTMAMVKAFSYGSGSFEIANLLQFHRVDYLAVAYTDEGVELRKAGITLPIMVMSPEASTFESIVQFNLEPELYSFQIATSFLTYLEQCGLKHYPIHIKIDSGMHRLGFIPAEMAELLQLFHNNERCKVQSVFSHLVASGDTQFNDFTKEQAKQFLQCCELLQQQLGYPFLRHIANSAAIYQHPELQLDMVRLGIGMYGIDGNPVIQQKLQQVTTLKTTIAQIKHIAKGETVGYNRNWQAQQNTTIATVRIGYADGYPRLLGNGQGKMWLNGQLAPVVGNVCMDMTMLDITGINAREGDEVVVFGKELPVAQVAAWAQTIAYEILAGVSQRVKRVYFEE